MQTRTLPPDSGMVLDLSRYDVGVRDGALIIPMPLAAYEAIMDAETLPRGACYNPKRCAMEIDEMPNGREHDRRSATMYDVFYNVSLLSGVVMHVGATMPVEPPDGTKRHPDASLTIDPAKIALLDSDESPMLVPDVVVEVDYTRLSPARMQERLDAYSRAGVLEVWVWERTEGEGEGGGSRGRAAVHAVGADGTFEERDESAVVPGMTAGDMAALMHEPNALRRERKARALAARLAPDIGRSSLLATRTRHRPRH